MSETLLTVEDLKVRFSTDNGLVTVVDGVTLQLSAGETLAVVGESGSGKSMTMLAVMGLIPKGIVEAKAIHAVGRNILNASDKDMRKIRGREIGMIFQDPMTSLNPVLTVGRQLTEMFEVHLGVSGSAARTGAVDLMKLVGVPSAETRMRDYPHQFSGGMRQRVMIAMAVACKPKILIADEPTTALDVTIQAQILDIIADLKRDFGMSMIIITHDLGVVAGIADRMMVMRHGKVVEEGGVDEVFDNPRTDYTRQLLDAVPRFDDEMVAPGAAKERTC
jgi:ABC-type dipeptide/oligopeptide/nickel transport system ATPase component